MATTLSTLWVYTRRAEAPNTDLYSFQGAMVPASDSDDVTNQTPLTADNLLLRGCSLRKTDWVVGVVVYTGLDTRIMMNRTISPRKVTQLERHMNVLVSSRVACDVRWQGCCDGAAPNSRKQCVCDHLNRAWHSACMCDEALPPPVRQATGHYSRPVLPPVSMSLSCPCHTGGGHVCPAAGAELLHGHRGDIVAQQVSRLTCIVSGYGMQRTICQSQLLV